MTSRRPGRLPDWTTCTFTLRPAIPSPSSQPCTNLGLVGTADTASFAAMAVFNMPRSRAKGRERHLSSRATNM